MAQFIYDRAGVPVSESIDLEVVFYDVAGNPKDTDSVPTIQIVDSSSSVVVSATAQGIISMSQGHYRFPLTVPTGYARGVWRDTWTGTLDGYAVSAVFDFIVNSQGSIEAVGTVTEPELELGDDNGVEFNQDEIRNINILLKMLKSRLRNTAFSPDGTPCNVFADADLISFICSALSEFNMTPTISGFTFADPVVSTLFADVLTQGSMLIAWAGQAILEAGREFQITDAGVQILPPPVSSTITAQYNAQLVDYRGKLKEIKRNLRAMPRGLGAGSILTRNPQVLRQRHRREGRIL